MNDANKNRLYVHEVFIANNIKKGDTLQTAAFQPHGGIALYKDILTNVLGERSSSDNKDNTPNAENQISEQENVSPVENKIAEWPKKLGVPAKVYHSVDEIPNEQARAAINAL